MFRHKIVFMMLCPMPGIGVFGAMQFTDVTSSANIDYLHSHNLTVHEFNSTYSLLSGGAVAEDFNGDGWMDLYVLEGGENPNLLYINQSDGTFDNQAQARGAAITGPHIAVCAADYDSDGDVDIFVAGMLGNHSLLINDGTGNFAVDSSMIPLPGKGATSPSFGDLNNDGLLELALGAWVRQTEEPGVDSLQIYLNTGNGQLSPYVSFQNEFDYTPRFLDLDGDRWQDFLAVADFIEHTRLYSNNGAGLLFESERIDIENGMGATAGDVDNDGDLDLFITAISRYNEQTQTYDPDGNRLLINNGSGDFTDATDSAGVRIGEWGWGTDMADFDNDGDLDIYMVNGWSPDGKRSWDTRAKLFENLGNNVFQEIAQASGDADDRGQGRSVVVFDYDNDGDQDIYIVNNSIPTDPTNSNVPHKYVHEPAAPVLLRNDSINDHHYLKVSLNGLSSPHNAHGIGARVYITTGEIEQMRELNASSGFVGHGPGRLAHFGLADNEIVDTVRAVWTNGDITQIRSIQADQAITLDSPQANLSARTISPGEVINASYPAHLLPEGAGTKWTIEGIEYEDQASHQFNEPGDYAITVGIYADGGDGSLLWQESLRVVVSNPDSDHRSIAQIWNERNLDAIRIDFPDPTAHARNLFASSVAMWDAWSAYDPDSTAVLHNESVSSDNVQSARREAISYAAYRVLKNRYSDSVNSSTTLVALGHQMQALGYDSSYTSTSGDSPAALGNRIAETVLEFMASDGWNETSGFMDGTYAALNDPLLVTATGTEMVDPNHWQPLEFDDAFTQNQQVADLIQEFLGPHWGAVRPFALLTLEADEILHIDPGSPPWIGTATEAEFKDGNVSVIEFSSLLDPGQDQMLDISPGALGNNTLGFNDGTGHPVNPVTGEPYPANVVNHADFGRILAEFWADGPDSETPPGHWNTLANELHEHPDFKRHYLGSEPEIDRLEWDVKTYLALNGALHDAAIAAWGCKRVYDYVRPISSIRYMGALGQSTDPEGASYHPHGLPLVDDLIEVITTSSSASGQRHEHLAGHIGEMAIFAWSAGEASIPGGVDWILAENWLPYQRTTFVTPAFPGYVSGHSTFSRAAAEIITRITGSAFFPGGLGTFTAHENEFLEFETGPTTDVVLQWGTYYDAADQAGISRLYGGIHVPADDGPGRAMGSIVGINAWDLAIKYFDGSILEEPIYPSLVSHEAGMAELRWNSIRGSYYKVQKAQDLSGSNFIDLTNWIQSTRTTESYLVNTDSDGFYRVVRSLELNP